MSILCNKVLDRIKIAQVVQIFKSGNPSSFSNYRPVSVLPRLCCNDFRDEHDVLDNAQFGVKKKHCWPAYVA